ncbi:MAG: hypothetical protein NTW85_10630 [Methylococcales bacterium]|nr:hypothetical protein [Methylococcales bacterium]
MTVSSDDFLTSAEILLQNTDNKEIDFRNVISRSYYAVFHLAKEKLTVLADIETMEEPDNNGSHNAIIDKFYRHNNRSIHAYGKIIKDLKKQRHIADYDIDKDILRNETAEHFNNAKHLITKLKKLNIK